MLLRLKDYTSVIFDEYYESLDAVNKVYPDLVYNQKRLFAQYSMVCQTLLFFNQAPKNQSFDNWVTNSDIPASYRLDLSDCVCLLVDSYYWAVSSVYTEDETKFRTDISKLMVSKKVLGNHGITKQYSACCNFIHEITTYPNIRTRSALIRLIKSYVKAVTLTNKANDLSGYDRISYLKSLTIY